MQNWRTELQEEPATGEIVYVGCPWQAHNPFAQIVRCEMWIRLGAGTGDCKGEECDQYRIHRDRHRELVQLRERIAELMKTQPEGDQNARATEDPTGGNDQLPPMQCRMDRH